MSNVVDNFWFGLTGLVVAAGLVAYEVTSFAEAVLELLGLLLICLVSWHFGRLNERDSNSLEKFRNTSAEREER